MKKRLSRRRGPHFRRRTAPGAAPGTVVVDPQAAAPVMRVIAYGPGPLVEAPLKNVNELDAYLDQYAVVWLNVAGLGDASVIQALGKKFHLHPLALEDVVNVHQRPKLEQYDDCDFIVARMVAIGEQVESEQVSIFLGKKFVLSFIEDLGDCFEPLRHRLRAADAKLLHAGASYLAYALLDAVTDAYFPVIEELGDRLDTLEDDLFVSPGTRTLPRIHAIKRDLRTLRRSIWPLREVMGTLSRESTPLIDDDTRVYLRDCYDHTVQLMDLVETYRELCSDLMDLFLSNQSNRMNEVMKVLTVIATVFIPLTFIAGIYGMNFDDMPELHWRYGYLWAWFLFVSIGGGMLYFFARKGWLKPFVSINPNDAKASREAMWSERPQAGFDLHHDNPPPTTPSPKS